MTSREELIGRVVAWAVRRDDVRVVMMTGSLAQEGAHVDEMSDIDLELTLDVVTPGKLAAAGAWWQEFGVVLSAFLRDPLPLWCVTYEGGLMLDVSMGEPERLERFAAAGKVSDAQDHGYRVLLDKDGLTARLPAPTGALPDPGPLTAEGFRTLVDRFWFFVLRVPKYVARGDLWAAKSRDWKAKEDLLRMLEWHAIVVGGHPSVGHGMGRGMPGWSAAHLWADAHDVFGRFEAADALLAFESTVALFVRAATEVAATAGFDFPAREDHLLSDLAEQMVKAARARPA